MKLLLALAPTICLVVFGQLVTRWRVVALQTLNQSESGLSRLSTYLADPWIVLAYAAVFASSITWIFVIERYPLSLAFPLHIGLTVFIVTLSSTLLFNEPLTPQRIVAIVLIIAGVIIANHS